MINMAQFWPVAICVGVGTYLVRASFLVFVAGKRLPEIYLAALRYIPPAVLSALIVPAVVLGNESTDFIAMVSKPISACMAGLVACKVKNSFVIIGSGMLMYWLFSWLGQL